MENIQLKKVHHTSADLSGLIAKLDEDLYRRYPADEVHLIDFTDPSIDDIIFIVAYLDEVPVGCGAIRPIDAEATELKRFFVELSLRKLGIAKRMLDFLEAEAKVLNFKMIKLETGAAQPEAVNFYQKYDYYAIAKFGDYIDCESSLCYEKVLSS